MVDSEVAELRLLLKHKTGAELFRELKRHNSTVVIDDYYKHGRWQDDLMRLDIEILDAHRKDAGSPELPPLSDIPAPEVPVVPKIPSFGNGLGQWAAGQIRPVGLYWQAYSPGLVAPPSTYPGASAAMAAALMAKARAAPSGAAVRVEVAVQIAVFASKWGLEAARAQALLAPLTPLRRSFVMTNFELAADGSSRVALLEELVAKVEREGAPGEGALPPSPSSVDATPEAGSNLELTTGTTHPSPGDVAPQDGATLELTTGTKRPLLDLSASPSKILHTGVA